jgi:hypothetical protein
MILTRTSPGPGDGIETSSMFSGLPNCRTTAAFINFVITGLQFFIAKQDWNMRTVEVLIRIKLQPELLFRFRI